MAGWKKQAEKFDRVRQARVDFLGVLDCSSEETRMSS
jgi:hypothetical protein